MSLEKLIQLEETGNHVFHGSANGELKTLEPRQGRHVPDPSKTFETILDGDPAVSATPHAELAAFRAIINTTNIPIEHHSGFGTRGAEKTFRVSSADVLEHAKDKKGFVYVFDKKEFEPYNRKGNAHESAMEWRSYKEVSPIDVVEVTSADLPPVEKIKIG